MQITLFYITNSTRESALSLGLKAVEKKLAACLNVFPIHSAYEWNEDIQHENEFVLILKTSVTRQQELRSFLEEKHPFDIPCILSWNVQVNDKYGKWVEEKVT